MSELEQGISLDFLDKHLPKNSVDAVHEIRQDVPALLRAYDHYVLGGYDAGSAFRYWLSERFERDVGRVFNEAYLHPERVAREMLRERKPRYAMRAAFAWAQDVFLGRSRQNGALCIGDYEWDIAPFVQYAYTVLTQMIIAVVRKQEKGKKEIKKNFRVFSSRRQ